MNKHICVHRFQVPKSRYARYNNTLFYATHLLAKYKNVIQSLQLSDEFPVPTFDDVILFVFSFEDSEDLSCEQVSNIRQDSIRWETLSWKEFLDVYKSEHQVAYGSCIFVAFEKCFPSCEDALRERGSNIIILTNDDVPATESKEIYSTKEDLSQSICLVLECAVLQPLSERIKVLQCFLQLQDPYIVFSNSAGFTRSPASELKTTSSEYMHLDEEEIGNTYSIQVWGNARLKATKQLIIDQYKISSEEFKKILIKKMLEKPKKKYFTWDQMLVKLLKCKAGGKQKLEIQNFIADIETFEDYKRQVKQLQKAYKEHYLLVRRRKDLLEQLYGEMQGMYYRSKVPLHKRPPVLSHMIKELDDTVADAILAVTGVTSVGYRFMTLKIFLDESLRSKERQLSEGSLKEILNRENISNYDFLYQPVEPKLFRKVGAAIDTGNKGTLGGFAQLGKQQKLCMLLAGHVSGGYSNVFVKNSPDPKDKSLFAVILPPLRRSLESEAHDIAIAEVVPRETPNCQTQLKDVTGNCLPSTLFLFKDLTWMFGLPVHIWGATTSPGLGSIVIPELKMKETTKKMLVIEDLTPEQGQEFAKEGDSGAIVCANDNDGVSVSAIAMLMGLRIQNSAQYSEAKPQYMAFRLKDGLDQLKYEQQEETLELC